MCSLWVTLNAGARMLALFTWLASLAIGLAADREDHDLSPRTLPEEDLTARIRRQSLARQRATLAQLRESERHLVGVLSEPDVRSNARLTDDNARVLQRVQDLRRRVEHRITESEMEQVH